MESMLRDHLKTVITMLILVLSIQFLVTCKSSEFSDIFERCEPDCSTIESELSVTDIEDALTERITSIPGLDNKELSGRWVLFAAKRYGTDQDSLKTVNDLIFTKSMIFTETLNGVPVIEGEVGDQITVSDCQQEETYALTESGFTIPQSSVFFSSLYFENSTAIIVNKNSDKELNGDWTFVSPQDTEETIDLTMFKVDKISTATSTVGLITTVEQADPTPIVINTDIFCYSYLNIISKAEILFEGNLVESSGQIEELFLAIDPNSFDQNIYLNIYTENGISNSTLVFDQGVDGQEYTCPGLATFASSSDDYLAFEGGFDITVNDIDCVISGRSKSTNSFSFSPL